MTALAADVPTAPLDQNLPCHRCGYNLRTLAPDARCPECSTPIASSLNPNLLRYADPSWTSILAVAFGLMSITLVLQLGYYVILLLLARENLFPLLGRAWDYFHFLERVHLFVGPLFWLAVFLTGHPEPSSAAPVRYVSLRRAMRVAAILTLLWNLLHTGTFQEGSMSQESWIEKPIGQVIELFAIILTSIFLLQIAKRTGIRRMMRHTIIGMLALILVYCSAIAVDIFSDERWTEPWSFYIGWVVAAIFLYDAYVFFLFRRTLRKSAAFARQYWHFCSPILSATP
jgi:hypothetical protein